MGLAASEVNIVVALNALLGKVKQACWPNFEQVEKKKVRQLTRRQATEIFER
jgi:hypothetical protein